MPVTSRKQAATWPYPRHRDFQKKLQQVAAAWFESHGFKTNPHRPYILDRLENWPNNIILPEVAAFIAAEQQNRVSRGAGFPLHKYLHHGLSSQAMLFNLIGPLIVTADLGCLAEPFDQAGLPGPEMPLAGQFEFENRTVFNEDFGQPTSLDLVIATANSGPAYFIEAKLVEQEFGGCSVFQAGDCDGRNPAAEFSLCYLHHLGRRYWTLLAKHGFLNGPFGDNATCILTTYYQFFRELLFAVELGGTFIVLYDERNPAFNRLGPHGQRGLLPFLRSLVPAALQSRLATLTIQQVVQAIEASGRHAWIKEFKVKYGLGHGPAELPPSACRLPAGRAHRVQRAQTAAAR
ncbi:MAG: hypothetical protein FOGNACKC_06317 [Anaerolineae bacterium]|nr:hypothetical protein [Anaerolineae bacterium]